MKTPRTTDCQIVLRLARTQKQAIKLAADMESRSMNNWLIQAVQAQLKAQTDMEQAAATAMKANKKLRLSPTCGKK